MFIPAPFSRPLPLQVSQVFPPVGLAFCTNGKLQDLLWEGQPPVEVKPGLYLVAWKDGTLVYWCNPEFQTTVIGKARSF
jgi:hypothetical protein